jgi:hypothetical protein
LFKARKAGCAASGALDVRQEAVAQASARARALDQAGDVGDHHDSFAELERAEIRFERRERIRGDLGARPSQGREQRGLAGVGQADESDVGQQLELQIEPALFAGQAVFGEARHAPGRGHKAGVAAAAFVAARHDDALTFDCEVGEQRAVAVADLGADRHLYDGRHAGLAVTLLAHPVTAALALEMHLVAKVGEVAELARGDHHDVAAGTAVAAVGAAPRHVLFAPETDGARSAVAAAHVDGGVIAQHGGESGRSGRTRALGLGNDGDQAPLATTRELDAARGASEDGVVDADAGACAGAKPGAALADDDRAGGNHLSGKGFDAESLGLGVATVATGASALLMSHSASPFGPRSRSRRCRAW